MSSQQETNNDLDTTYHNAMISIHSAKLDFTFSSRAAQENFNNVAEEWQDALQDLHMAIKRFREREAEKEAFITLQREMLGEIHEEMEKLKKKIADLESKEAKRK